MSTIIKPGKLNFKVDASASQHKEICDKDSQVRYNKGEENVQEIWNKLKQT